MDSHWRADMQGNIAGGGVKQQDSDPKGPQDLMTRVAKEAAAESQRDAEIQTCSRRRLRMQPTPRQAPSAAPVCKPPPQNSTWSSTSGIVLDPILVNELVGTARARRAQRRPMMHAAAEFLPPGDFQGVYHPGARGRSTTRRSGPPRHRTRRMRSVAVSREARSSFRFWTTTDGTSARSFGLIRTTWLSRPLRRSLQLMYANQEL